MTDNRTTERVDHPPRVRGAIDELMREKDATCNRTTELLPCPFCGGEARMLGTKELWFNPACSNAECGCEWTDSYATEAEAIAAWNSRAAMEFDNWFYLPKPKETIVEVTEKAHAWDGTKVKTDVFYQVQEQAVINWAKELDKYIIKRICEVWNSRAERTCRIVEYDDAPIPVCSECGAVQPDDYAVNYCWGCGARVRDE